MQSLVVFLALAVAAHGSYLPLAQPPHHPAIVLDPHGRPLDTAEVIGARALHLQAKALEPQSYLSYAAVAPIAHSVVAPAVVAAPAAVSHQSRVDVHSSPAIVATQSYAAPVWGAHSAYASPLLAHSGLIGHGHLLKKRSLEYLRLVAYSSPIIAPSAVSHQSHVDVVSSPAIVSHSVAAPVVSHAVATPVVAHAAPVFSAASVWGAQSVYASPLLAHSGLIGHGHLLKKRSLGYLGAVAYSSPIIAPSAVSHQSRVDVVSSPAIVSHVAAAPVLSHAVAAPVVAHAIAPAAVSHQSRVDVRSSPAVVAHAVAPLAHSVVAAPLVHSAPLAYGLHDVHGLHGLHGW